MCTRPQERAELCGKCLCSLVCLETAAWDANLITIDTVGGVAGPAQYLFRPSLALSNLKEAFQGF